MDLEVDSVDAGQPSKMILDPDLPVRKPTNITGGVLLRAVVEP